MSPFDRLRVTEGFKLNVSLSLSKTDERMFEVSRKLNERMFEVSTKQ
jgi:hypothetical protein